MTGVRAVILALTGFASLGTWVLAISACFSQANDVDDIADSSFIDASAVQISQVANQGLLRSVAYLSVAFGSTAAFLVVAIWVFGSLRR